MKILILKEGKRVKKKKKGLSLMGHQNIGNLV